MKELCPRLRGVSSETSIGMVNSVPSDLLTTALMLKSSSKIVRIGLPSASYVTACPLLKSQSGQSVGFIEWKSLRICGLLMPFATYMKSWTTPVSTVLLPPREAVDMELNRAAGLTP